MSILASPFNLGGPDGLIIFIIVLLLFGAKRLPELARGLGSAVREFSKAKDEIQHEITRSSSSSQPPLRNVETPSGTESQYSHHDDPYHQESYPHHDSAHDQTAQNDAPKTDAEKTQPGTGPAAGGATTPV